MNNKYELLKNDTKIVNGITLFRIKAKISFSNIIIGELGGYVEKESCLSVSGDAWVSGDAQVYGNARVFDNAWVFGNARVSGDARVSGNARVSGDAQVYGNAQVFGDARVYDNAWVSGDAWVLTGYINLSLENISVSLMAQLGIALINNKCVLYKRVNKISKGKYSSCYDKNFIYQTGKISKVNNPDLTNASCATGIHLSTALYWNEGDTLIACEVKKEDIITVQAGKVRVKKCKVLGEVTI